MTNPRCPACGNPNPQPWNGAPNATPSWRDAARGRTGCPHCDRRHAPAPPKLHPELAAALNDLNRIPNPHPIPLDNARRLLPSLHHISPRRFIIHPEDHGQITITAGSTHAVVTISCHPDGAIACAIQAQNQEDNRCAWYSTPRILPDRFMREALNELLSANRKPNPQEPPTPR